MAKGDRRSDLFRLFTRPKRSKDPSKLKSVRWHGGDGRITDALGATRAMRPEVLPPQQGGLPPQRPELTVIHPRETAPRPLEPHVQVANRRLRFSLSYLACSTLLVAFCLLLLVSFVMGMRYQGSRSRPVGPPQGTGLAEVRPGEDQGGGRGPMQGARQGGGAVDLGIPGRETPPAPSGPQYRLRIAVYAPTEREMADKSAALLREQGVPVVLLTRVIDGRSRLVVYSEQHFDSRSSPEALALVNKVKLTRQDGRYDFASAYFVVVD